MKLTREDIQKYGTEEEKNFLKEEREELDRKTEKLIRRYIENEGLIDELQNDKNSPDSYGTSSFQYLNKEKLLGHIKQLRFENEKIKFKIGPKRLARILKEF
jgi:hypothetical protein